MDKIGKYQIEHYISKGACGKVYKASYNGNFYALKQIPKPKRSKDNIRLNMEIQALSEFHHQNIVALYEVFQQKEHIFMVMEYCQESLASFIETRGTMDEPRAYEIMKSIVHGLNELAKLKIVHRDLKPANILYHKGTFKIADFGLAKYLDQEEQLLESIIGTYCYMCPQILNGEKYTNKCDIWSLGVIFYYILFCDYPWSMQNKDKILRNILSNPISFSRKLSQHTRNLIAGMLTVDQNQRFSLSTVSSLLLKQPIQFESTLVNMFSMSSLDMLVRLEVKHLRQAEGKEKRYSQTYLQNRSNGQNRKQHKQIMEKVISMHNQNWRDLVGGILENIVSS